MPRVAIKGLEAKFIKLDLSNPLSIALDPWSMIQGGWLVRSILERVMTVQAEPIPLAIGGRRDASSVEF